MSHRTSFREESPKNEMTELLLGALGGLDVVAAVDDVVRRSFYPPSSEGDSSPSISAGDSSANRNAAFVETGL